ncbi:MAG: tetratricopeptide repeat protein [Candidatus Sulfotelmatobacter sp.]
MKWIAADRHPDDSCHCDPGAKPGVACPERRRREPAFKIAPRARLFIVLLSFLSLAFFPLAAQTPQALLDAGQVDQVMQMLEQQIRSAPTPETYNLLCRAYLELENWDAGIHASEKAVTLAPDDGLYHLWLGRIYGEKADRSGFLSAAGLAGKVRSEFERGVELSPNSWEARTDLAEFYLEAPGIVGGGKDKARAQAEALVALNPSMAHWVRGRIAEREKETAVAEQEFRAAVTASQGGARAWLNLAGFYRHADRFDEMEQALHSMESSRLDHPAAFVDGASMLFRAGLDYPLAIQLLRSYLGSSNTVEEAPAFKAHYLLGELLEKQSARADAAEEYRAALSMAHSFRPAQDALKRVTR